MDNTEKIDARGLSCPQPVMLAGKAMKKVQKGTIEVLVDTDTARENVLRLAQHEGWTAQEDKREADDYRLVLKK